MLGYIRDRNLPFSSLTFSSVRPQNSLSYKTQQPVLDAEGASVTTSSRGGGFHAKDMGVDSLRERACPRMGNAHEVELKLNTRCAVEPCWEGLEIAGVICNGKGNRRCPIIHKPCSWSVFHAAVGSVLGKDTRMSGASMDQAW